MENGIKVIIENNITYKITGERADFYICELNGKGKMFAKHEVVVIEVSELPKPKVWKQKTSNVSANEIINFKKIEINAMVNEGSSNLILFKINEIATPSDIVKSILTQCATGRELSDKQLFVIAKFVIENNIKL